jgi:hypothetical protein
MTLGAALVICANCGTENEAQPAVRTAGESARQILSRLGAAPFLERLDAAMARPISAATKNAGEATRLEERPAVLADEG